MQKAKGGLGRGLSSLIAPAAAPRGSSLISSVSDEAEDVDIEQEQETAPASDIQEDVPLVPVVTVNESTLIRISPDQVTENPRQPRRVFAQDELEELAASIKEHGILQPISVSQIGPERYELIAGERRLRAARLAGLKKIPVIVRPEEEDQKKLELALIENIQRQDLNPVEEARAYRSLMYDFGLRQEEVADRVGKSRSAVGNTIRLLDLPAEMLDALEEGRLSRSHARTLLSEPVPSRRKELFDAILRGEMTVREVEARAGTDLAGSRRKSVVKDPNIQAIESGLRDKWGTKVTVDGGEGRGTISLYYYSKDDLKVLVERLMNL